MAEQNAAPKEAAAAAPEAKQSKPTLFIILAIINMAVVGGVGAMLYLGKKKDNQEPKVEHVVAGEHDAQRSDAEKVESFSSENVKLEPFVVNMAGSRGRRLARVTMELEVDSTKVSEEIESRSAQIRDIIIILLSSKTFEAVSSRDGKESLREEIKDNVNGFLTKGKIKKVLFTEFIYN